MTSQSRPPSFSNTVAGQITQILGAAPGPGQLTQALRHLAKWRAQVLADTLVARSGDKVLSGPFAGMSYGMRAAEGSRTARLIGCYEASLAPVIETIIDRAYPLVIDVGSAEGYYAVGLARRMPSARVMARDSSLPAQTLCRALAEVNDVGERVSVGGLFTHADLDICQQQDTVIICDIEGAEAEFLDPEAAPGLLAADILVEVHEGMRPGLLAVLERRFTTTHTVTRLDRRLDDTGLPDWAETLSDLDRLLLMWEWRASPTPWLWIQRRTLEA